MVGCVVKNYVALSVCRFVEVSVTPIDVFPTGEGGAVAEVMNVDYVVGDPGEDWFKVVVVVDCMAGEYVN